MAMNSYSIFGMGCVSRIQNSYSSLADAKNIITPFFTPKVFILSV